MNKANAILLAMALLIASSGCTKADTGAAAQKAVEKTAGVEVRKANMERKATELARSGAAREEVPQAAQGRNSQSQQIPADYPAVVYGSDNPKAQVIGIYLAKTDKPAPLLVWIHGGGWSAGSYKQIPDFAEELLKMGVAVASVEYRFTQEAIHPAQVNDCQRAIQFLRANAGRLNIDPARVGVAGGSAGAHLTLCMATFDDAANPRSKDPVERESSRVSCAVSFAGPADWSLLNEVKHGHPAYWMLLGYEPQTPYVEMNPDLIADVSPITHISKDDAPALLCHGNDDPVVPIQHAKRMEQAMKRAGLDCRLVAVDNVGHGPGRDEEVKKATMEFFTKYLLDAKSAGVILKSGARR